MSVRIDYTKVAPAGVKALGGVYGYILQSGLSDVLVELVYLRISQISCAYCLIVYLRPSEKGGSRSCLVQVWREAQFCSMNASGPRSRVELLRVARPQCLAVINRTHVFSEGSVDLTIAIGLMNTYNRMAIGFRINLGCAYAFGRMLSRPSLSRGA